jgi:hypothetical protein
MKHITQADVEFAAKMHIQLEPELTMSEMRLISAKAQLESANETIAGLQKAYDFMRARRDIWHRRWIATMFALMLVVIGIIRQELSKL